MRPMKSLAAIDFVVFIILAVIVLALAVFLLKGAGMRGVESGNLEKERAKLCLEYLSLDADCDGNLDIPTGETRTKKQTVIENLKKICPQLGYENCRNVNWNNADSVKACVRQCCRC